MGTGFGAFVQKNTTIACLNLNVGHQEREASPLPLCYPANIYCLARARPTHLPLHVWIKVKQKPQIENLLRLLKKFKP